ncbi:MAG: PilN domain-containing protein [Methylovulum sp.]|nr:PilN domain-containing protein [Methylovulum sp.]
MMNLTSTIDLDFKRFLRWWRRELMLLVPEKTRQLLIDQHGWLVVSPEQGYLNISYALAGDSVFVATVARNEAGAAQFKALQDSNEKLGKARVVLRLSGPDGLHRELVLPAAVKENLQQVVAYELDKYTPFKAEQVYFAVKPLGVQNEPGYIKAMLVLTTQELLDGLYEDLKAMGLSPLLADYEGFANDLDDDYGAYNLLPERFRQKTANTPRLIYSVLSALAGLLLLTVLVLPVALQYQTVTALAEKVKVIEKDAKKIKVLQQEVDSVINETQKLLDEKRSRPMMVVMLNELSRLIKDDTWLAYLQYADGHLQIQGESPAASTLIGVLEASDLFNNARFASPVTQNTVSKLERFQITVDVTQIGGGTHEAP